MFLFIINMLVKESDAFRCALMYVSTPKKFVLIPMVKRFVAVSASYVEVLLGLVDCTRAAQSYWLTSPVEWNGKRHSYSIGVPPGTAVGRGTKDASFPAHPANF